MRRKRLPEVSWNTLRDKKGSRQISGELPLILQYVENGRTIKVYPAASSFDLVGEGRSAKSGNASYKNITYPAI